MTLGDIIAQSSNIGTIQVADMLGSGPLATYLARFGFGRPTGIGFPGEASGVMLPLYEWSDTSLATMALRPGHLRDAAADGLRLRDDRERRDVGPAAAGGGTVDADGDVSRRRARRRRARSSRRTRRRR